MQLKEHIFLTPRSHLEKKLLTGVLSFIMCLGEDFIKTQGMVFWEGLVTRVSFAVFLLTLLHLWYFFYKFHMLNHLHQIN